MATYNTGNPLGSTDARDLNDNAQNFDKAINSTDPTFTDRLGKEQTTLAGFTQKIDSIEPAVTGAVAQVAELTDRAETAADSASGLSNAYRNLTQAQAAITSGKIPDGGLFSTISTDPKRTYEIWQNVGGTPAAVIDSTTGRQKTYPSGDAVDEAANIAQKVDSRTEEITKTADLLDEEGQKIIGGIFDKNGISPIYGNVKGGVGLSNLKIKPENDGVSLCSINSRDLSKQFFRGSAIGNGGILGNAEICEIPGPAGFVLVDKNYIPFAADPVYAAASGQDIPPIGGSSVTPIAKTTGFRPYDIMGFRIKGQSLSLGIDYPATSAANPAISTTQPFGNVGFSGTQNSDTTATDTMVALVEQNYMPTEGTYPASESCATGATSKLVEMIEADTGLSWEQQGTVYFGSCPGMGGVPISSLAKGTVPYQRMLDHVTNSVRLAAQAGKTFAELANFWLHGETNYGQNTSRESYKTQYYQLISDDTADTMAITGQKEPPIWISYQLSTHRYYNREVPVIALALRDAVIDGKSAGISSPGYIYDYQDDVHRTNVSYQMESYYAGRLVFKLKKDREAGRADGKYFLDVIDEVRQGNFVDLLFNVPCPPLVFDTEWVTAYENMGFQIRNSTSFAVQDIITAVDIVGSDRVRLTCSRPVGDTEMVTYAWGKITDPAKQGRMQGPRGNLRDSEGDQPGQSYVDVNGVTRKLHNWCVIF